MIRASSLVLVLLIIAASGAAQAQTPLVGMGDSITEGVQSLNASVVSQPHSYINLIARQMGVNFPLPLILSSPLSIAEDVAGRVDL